MAQYVVDYGGGGSSGFSVTARLGSDPRSTYDQYNYHWTRSSYDMCSISSWTGVKIKWTTSNSNRAEVTKIEVRVGNTVCKTLTCYGGDLWGKKCNYCVFTNNDEYTFSFESDSSQFGGNPYGGSTLTTHNTGVNMSDTSVYKIYLRIYYSLTTSSPYNDTITPDYYTDVTLLVITVYAPVMYAASISGGARSGYLNNTLDLSGVNVVRTYKHYINGKHAYSETVTNPSDLFVQIGSTTTRHGETLSASGSGSLYYGSWTSVNFNVYAVATWGEPTLSTKYAVYDNQPSASAVSNATVTYEDDTTSSSSVTFSGWNSNSVGEIIITYSYSASKTGQTHSYTSKVTIMEYEPALEGQIKSVVLNSAKHIFTPNETIDYGDSAYLTVTKKDNTTFTLSKSDFYKRVFGRDAKYNASANNYLQEGAVDLSSRAYGVTFYQRIGFTYNVTSLLITDPTTRQYYYYPSTQKPASVSDLDMTGLVVRAYRKTSTYNSSNNTITTTTTTDTISNSNVTKTIAPAINGAVDQQYTLKYSYTNEYNQSLTGQANAPIRITPYAPRRIIISNSELSFYEDISAVTATSRGNAYNIFNPSVTYLVEYTDGTTASLDASNVTFYRDQPLTVSLALGTSILKSAQDLYGSHIYAKATVDGQVISGTFNITWQQDTINTVVVGSYVEFYLGNRLQSQRSNLVLIASMASGATGNVVNYDFAGTSANIIMSDQNSITISVNNTNYTVATNDDTVVKWLKPFAKIEYNTSNFQNTYTNGADTIYPSNLVVTMRYYKTKTGDEYSNPCEYTHLLEYASGNDYDVGEYVVEGGGILENYGFEVERLAFETSEMVVDGQYSSEVPATITLSAKSDFDTTEVVEEEIDITIMDIVEITGLKLLNVKNTYYVGETFLNEEDETMVRIFYTDENGNGHAFDTKLSNNLTALNIYPLKGTEFNAVVSNKEVVVKSATDYNVSVTYAIDVKNNYEYGKSQSHNVVALKIANYECPDKVSRTRYYLIDRLTHDGRQATREDETTGERLIGIGVVTSDLIVYGYLEDLALPFDTNTAYVKDDLVWYNNAMWQLKVDSSTGAWNASNWQRTLVNTRVILFNDYIPPVEGQNNIVIKFPCYVEGNSDLINKCHFGIVFGNNNSKNRLFLSGNPDYINKDWHSGQVDIEQTDDETMLTGNFGYFEDLSVCVYGETDNAVIGYDIVSNDKLLVLKNHSDKETTVYFRQPQLVTAINNSGTAVTGIDDETLYQEEFSLSQGNNSVAGIAPEAVVNFNGDSLFISSDKQLVGLDLTGIIGDNQRYATTRSYFIDEDLKNQDLDGAFLWSNNKYLMLVLKEKIYVTHFEITEDKQYDWFVIDVKNVSSILDIDGVIHFGTTDGKFFTFTEKYDDITKVFAGYGMVTPTLVPPTLEIDDRENVELITATGYLDDLDWIQDDDNNWVLNGNYYFKPVPFEKSPYDLGLYFNLGGIRGTDDGTVPDCDFYVDNNDDRHVLQLKCIRNGEYDAERMNLIIKRIGEKTPVYFDQDGANNWEIELYRANALLADCSGLKFYLREYLGEDAEDYLFQVVRIVNGEEQVVHVEDLVSAKLCMKVDRPVKMINVDKTAGTFSLEMDGEKLDIVTYGEQRDLIQYAIQGEITRFDNVEAYYITKPYTMGSLEYFKTIWSFTLTNDSNVPSELDICVANNKIPYETMKTLAYFKEQIVDETQFKEFVSKIISLSKAQGIRISREEFGLDFNKFNFAKIDFDKSVVPRTYTHKRILSGVKFVCFGFKNYNNTNSVLSSMSITYTLPYPSYSGD